MSVDYLSTEINAKSRKNPGKDAVSWSHQQLVPTPLAIIHLPSWNLQVLSVVAKENKTLGFLYRDFGSSFNLLQFHTGWSVVTCVLDLNE